MNGFQLNLTKPLAFFDLETTGTSVGADRIIDISILRVDVNNRRDSKTWRVNPGILIPPSSTKVHGISDEMVKNSPLFAEVAREISDFLKDCDLAGYNSNKFDVPLLVEEFMRAEVDFDLHQRKLIDVQNLFHLMEPRSLVAAYKFYCGKDHIDAHNAAADVEATYDVFCSQLQRYQDVQLEDAQGNKFHPVQNDMKVLSELTTRTKNVDLMGRVVYDENGKEIFNFGKYKGRLVKEVFEKDPGYYGWIMQGDFPAYTKKVITRLRLEMKSAR